MFALAALSVTGWIVAVWTFVVVVGCVVAALLYLSRRDPRSDSQRARDAENFWD